MEVSETLKKAWAAVEDAGLPTNIHEAAFREAVRLLVPVPVVTAAPAAAAARVPGQTGKSGSTGGGAGTSGSGGGERRPCPNAAWMPVPR